MKRVLQFVGLFLVSFPFISVLPLFIQKTMTRSQTEGGDIIDYNWQTRSLYSFLSDAKLARPEEDFIFYLTVNLVLACLYASAIAIIIVLFLIFLNYRKKKLNGK